MADLKPIIAKAAVQRRSPRAEAREAFNVNDVGRSDGRRRSGAC